MLRLREAGALLLGALVLTLSIAAPAKAQTTDPYEAITAKVEKSMLALLLPEFGELYWSFGYTAPQARDAQVAGPEALNLNVARLGAHVQAVCGSLTERQRGTIDTYVLGNFLQMQGLLAGRGADLRANFTRYRRDLPGAVPFSVAGDCGTRTETGPKGVSISRDLVLSAMLGAMLADTQVFTWPKDTFPEIEGVVDSAYRPWDRRRARAALERLRRSVVWRNYLRQQVQLVPEPMSLDFYEQEHIYKGLQTQAPECRRDPLRCEFDFTAIWSLASASKFDAYFTGQLRFVMGHELGHYFLDHANIPPGNCAVDRQLELDADAFALTLLRPPGGLFKANARQGADAAFDTGVDLFLMQGHRLAGLPNGDTCAYPTFEERRDALKRFEVARFGPNGSARR